MDSHVTADFMRGSHRCCWIAIKFCPMSLCAYRNGLAVFHHVAPVNLTSSSSHHRAVGVLNSSVHGLMPLDLTAEGDNDLTDRMWEIM